MSLPRILTLALLVPALSACQSLKPSTNTATDTRLQGSITQENNQWRFQSCDASKNYSLQLPNSITEQLNRLHDDSSGVLFADIKGKISSPNTFTVSQLYRAQAGGYGCNDSNFQLLLLKANGNEPFWSILQTPKGLILNRPGETPLALPYIEEQLPDGRYYVSTQANQQKLQLWITPKTCTDSMSGALYHLSAQLQWNQQRFNGCAAFGAQRN